MLSGWDIGVKDQAVGIGYRVAESHRAWDAVWWKPWTWFRWITVIDRVELDEVSLLSPPLATRCDECDWTFGCFNGSEPCRKKPLHG